ncbi:MAG: hypothetical protein ABW185_10125 [Sedimenticola sp.]
MPSGIRAPANKRVNTEMCPNSSVEEITVINQQLEGLSEDIKSIREDLQTILKKTEMEQLIHDTIHTAISELNENIELTIIMKVEEKTKDLQNKIQSLESENLCLKKDVTTLKNQLASETKRLTVCETRSMTALSKSNYNEQYSRKTNIKIMDIQEKPNETEGDLVKSVSELCQKQGVTLQQSKIVAIHRIPSKPNQTRPVLIKLANGNEKTKIMKQRSIFKTSGNRLVDDVTKLNSELISRLLAHNRIEQAWYYNGAVYGKSIAGKRHRFDLFDRIDDILLQ